MCATCVVPSLENRARGIQLLGLLLEKKKKDRVCRATNLSACGDGREDMRNGCRDGLRSVWGCSGCIARRGGAHGGGCGCGCDSGTGATIEAFIGRIAAQPGPVRRMVWVLSKKKEG